ncbi:MAG: VanZ family protein [Deltaproteobacteria bacterium]|nr:VanZ family protein [Deltaproteobacteria bacterium]MBN2673685.1 VanZ family protein [Deltaproteobacteria bacterium]
MSIYSIFDRAWAWITALLIYLVAIFVVSHMTASQLVLIDITVWDKLAHFFEYLPVGFLICGWIHKVWSRSTLLLVAVAISSVIGLACLDELHQYFVPTRDSSIFDIAADTLGGAVGIGIACVVLKRKNKTRLSAS